MSEPPPPHIDPETFDLIVVGTGLPESVVAAAAASAGKSVLHLDPNPFYGSHFSSLSLSSLSSFISSSGQQPPPDLHKENGGLDLVELPTRPVYSHLEISSHSLELEGQDGKFLVDVSGPRVLLCAERFIDVLIKSGASNYVEFKGVDATFIAVARKEEEEEEEEVGKGKELVLWRVPDSRAAIFKDKALSLMEKRRLMELFKLVQAHLEEVGEGDVDEGRRSRRKIVQEDLERPFSEFLSGMKLPPKIKSIIMYAIALADYDQEDMTVCKNLLKTKDGIDRLALYQSSVGRFTNAPSSLIYPIYGQGELPQAFCRRAAVKGCLYVLRMPVNALLVEKSDGSYKGVRLSSGQVIYSRNLVLDPSFVILSQTAYPSDQLHEKLHFRNMSGDKQKVARGICITRSSLKPDMSNLLVVFPPRSLYSEQVTSVRVLQIGGNLAVCPQGMFVLYLSTLCNDCNEGKKLLNAAIGNLFSGPDSANPESLQKENANDIKPRLLWSALYIQELIEADFDSICSTPMPDGSLNYHGLLDDAIKLFGKIYPNEEFFAETTSENCDDDVGLSLDT